MKTRMILILFLVFSTHFCTEAQEAEILLNMVLENNKELKLAREAYRVALLKSGTGNTPSDPEVELGYLYGDPAESGNRIDFGVTQQLDFPTTYIHRSKVKNINSYRAELEYLLIRQEVLLRARQLWIEGIHLNQHKSLLSERLREARSIQNHVDQKVDAGEVGLLELGQSNLLVASLEGEFEEVISLQEMNQLALLEMTGGFPFEIRDTFLPEPVQIIPDTLFQAYRMAPYFQLHQQGLQLKEEQKNLAVSEHLPRISAGYYSESVVDQALRGFRLGLSVPLWENANTVNKAKSEVIEAEADLDHFASRQDRELNQKLKKLETLRSQVYKLEKALTSANTLSLLNIALENGEISFSEYFYTSDFYFQNQEKLLRYKRDLLIQEADLLKVYL